MNHHTCLVKRGKYIAVAIGTLFLAFQPPLQAQQTCRQLSRGDTVVVIEASNDQKFQQVNQVINQHSLQGNFCASRRSGKTVWMSNQLDSVKTAIRVFDYFRAAGLVTPAQIIPPGGNVPDNAMPIRPYRTNPNGSNSIGL